MADEVIAIQSITALQSANLMWRIMSADFGVYFTESQSVVDLAARALRNKKLLKIDGMEDKSGRVVLGAVVILERDAPEPIVIKVETNSSTRLF